MNFSLTALFCEACSTSWRIRLAAESWNPRVTSTRKAPDRLTQPANTSSPAPQSRGRDSPVRAEASSWLSPSSTLPSRGIRSPGRSRMVCPTATSFASTVRSAPFSSTLAWSGRMSMRERMDRRDLATARPWRYSPTR